ncbi:hypothetical protein [Dyadobacter sandarakinus]|uniref:Phage protein n=1 Tax=Dyadobacter sandarakinus TaxID=2747268 RepID=A0ABX7I3J7_9BACT|nr:hypothetical protein [Dyadobacter sandarakinus]QRR00624.1 hypothetical protein HWI92_06730 [Dyadobacter sandarakinus]
MKYYQVQMKTARDWITLNHYNRRTGFVTFRSDEKLSREEAETRFLKFRSSYRGLQFRIVELAFESYSM